MSGIEFGNKIVGFVDLNGNLCSIQESSLATDTAIWLGMHTDYLGERTKRMLLNQEMAAKLIPLLRNFVLTGELE